MYKITVMYSDKRKTAFESKSFEIGSGYLAFKLTDKISYYIPFTNVLEFRVEEN